MAPKRVRSTISLFFSLPCLSTRCQLIMRFPVKALVHFSSRRYSFFNVTFFVYLLTSASSFSILMFTSFPVSTTVHSALWCLFEFSSFSIRHCNVHVSLPNFRISVIRYNASSFIPTLFRLSITCPNQK